MEVLIYAMVYLGSALMVYNIIKCWGFVKRMRAIPSMQDLRYVLPIPLILVILFLIGYLAVGLFGSPDLIIGGILFGGSIYVAIVMSVMYRTIDNLRESTTQSDALYEQAQKNLEELAANYLSVFRVNLTKDVIEEYVGDSHYEGEVTTGSYTEFMDGRRKNLLADVDAAAVRTLFTRNHLLALFADGRTSISERLFVRTGDGHASFIELQATLTTHPETGDVIGFFTEGECNNEVINETLLNKALSGQFDMITSLFGDQYNVVIGESAGRRGSIFPEEMQGSYQHYLDTQVTPVISGTSQEKRQLAMALQFQTVEDALASEEPYVVNIPIELDGETFYKRFVFYEIDRAAHFYLLLKSDTTEAHLAEAARANQLEEALEEAKQANRARAIFLSNISHDIHTPMNAVIGYTEVAKKCTTIEEVRGYLDKIDASSAYMNALVDDALEMSRIDSGALVLNLEQTNLIQYAASLQKLFSAQMAEKNIAYTVDASGIRDGEVLCDRIRLNSLLMNLVSNAYKYTPEGGSVQVLMNQLEDAAYSTAVYEFRVKDSGIGMSEEFAKHAFDAFEREQTTTESGIHGTGLGLAVCKGIVNRVGGTIELVTEQGKGSEFIVRVPIERISSVTIKGAASFQVAEPMDFTGMRALLVEDNEINREIAEVILEELGFEVTTAEDGKQALDTLVAAGPGEFDVVVTDIKMPVMDGHEEARAIRALDDPQLANIPIVAISANSFAEDAAASLDAGMDAHLGKPIDYDLIQETLTRVFTEHRARA